MKAYWEKYATLFNARVLRERLIIAICAFAAIYLLWDFMVLRGLSERKAALDLRYKTSSTEIQKLSAEERVLSQALLNNPAAKKQREIVQLNDRLVALDKEIATLSVGLVPAKQLPDVLRDVLLDRSDLQLIGLHALEPEKLSLVKVEEAPDFNAGVKHDDVGVFKHRVIMRVQGSYFAIRDYLRELEESAWHFYWSAVDYHVEHYPEAIVQIEVYTLSTERGFIGE